MSVLVFRQLTVVSGFYFLPVYGIIGDIRHGTVVPRIGSQRRNKPYDTRAYLVYKRTYLPYTYQTIRYQV